MKKKSKLSIIEKGYKGRFIVLGVWIWVFYIYAEDMAGTLSPTYTFDVLIDTLGSWNVIENFLHYIIDGGRVELIAEEYKKLADIDFYKDIHRRSLILNSRNADISSDMTSADLKHNDKFLDYLIKSKKLDILHILD